MRLGSRTQESIVGCSFVAGLVVTGAALFAIYLFGLGGGMHAVATRNPNTGQVTDAGDWNLLPLALVVLFLGIGMLGGSLGYGFFVIHGQRRGRRRTIEYFRILARFAVNRSGDMLTSDWEIEGADRPRFYVRGTFPNGGVEEYEVSELVFYSCGEGMSGEAEIQGRWLGRFVPYIGPPA